MTQGQDDGRDPLLREADHRNRNDLQLIASLANLQARAADDEAARTALAALCRRITAISIAQRHVKRVAGHEWTDAAGLVGDIAAELARPSGVALDLALEPILLPARQGAPLALVVTELVGNAFAHAFPDGRAGRVSVVLRRSATGIEFSVTDDGAGMGASTPPRFGLTIARLMAQQLRGDCAFKDAQPGLSALVSAPMDNEAAPA